MVKTCATALKSGNGVDRTYTAANLRASPALECADSVSANGSVVGKLPEQHAFVDMGYRGHDYAGGCEIHVDKRRRGTTPKSLWKWMKRRAAIEPGISHLQQEHRMDRFRLKGIEGDGFNVVLSGRIRL